MKFFEEHFTKHHLFHKPHRWFLAFLVSPVHAAEMHYKKKYHLNFIHAKKLFLFDMALLASILVLVGSTVFWFLYDPTITDLVHVDIGITSHTSEEDGIRVRSGEHITYTIEYVNNSDVAMRDTILTLDLPEGFEVEHVEGEGVYDSGAHSVPLDTLAPKTSGSLTVVGFFWGNVGEEYRLTTILTYKQEGREIQEQKRAASITTLHDSTLVTSVETSDSILANGSTPIAVTLSNPYHHTVPQIALSLDIGDGLRIEPLETSHGTTDASTWLVGDLEEGVSTTLRGMLVSTLAGDTSGAEATVSPTVNTPEGIFTQKPFTKTLEILHPRISAQTSWANGVSNAEPGKAYPLVITLANTGAADMENLVVSLPIPSAIVDTVRIRELNNGFVDSSGNFIVNQNHKANLASLRRGANTVITLQIPIRWTPRGGTDVGLSLTPHISSGVSGVDGANYRTSGGRSIPLAIGTQLGITAESRYYTNEGDQLGRGPLPPRVGKETKYWAMIRISNSTSFLSNPRFSATLPPGVRWTGKSSVSHGRDVSYNSGSNIISWSHNGLAAHQQAGVFFELAIVPNESQIGTTPLLLQNIRVTAHDNFTNRDLTRTANNISTAIPNDSIGRNKGVTIQPALPSIPSADPLDTL